MRRTPASCAAATRLRVPCAMIRSKSAREPLMIATRCTTASAPAHAARSEVGSVMSPSTSSTPQLASRPARRRPRTSARTGRSRARKAWTTWGPTKPVPPVTRTVMCRDLRSSRQRQRQPLVDSIAVRAETVDRFQRAARNDASAGRFDPATSPAGIFPAQYLRQAVDRGWIRGPSSVVERIQPASLDLTLGTTAYRLQCSFLPDRESSVDDKLRRYTLEEFSIADGAILERGRAYLLPLQEELALPESVRGRANPKSSTGRLDIFTRVISDANARFDDIPLGYTGPLYLEVVPRSFIIRVQTGLSLSQVRLLTGDPGEARLSDAELAQLH